MSVQYFIFDPCCTDVTSDDGKLLRCVHLDMWLLNFVLVFFCWLHVRSVFYIIFDPCCTDVTYDDSKLLRCIHLDMWSLNFVLVSF